MIKCIQHRLIDVAVFTAEVWPLPEHGHTQYEITFVHKGRGYHRLNGITQPYEAGNLFLLGPSDVHVFDIHEETEFTIVKFIQIYLKGSGDTQVQTSWNRYIDGFLVHAIQKNPAITEPCFDRETMDSLMRLIGREWQKSQRETSELIFFLTHAVLSLIKNHLTVKGAETAGYQDKIAGILQYIHENIYQPDRIQISHLAQTFHLSETYLSEFFKTKTGVSLRDYVARYRLTLIENRLQYSSFSVKEIANELGFSDTAHLTKFFSKHREIAPTEYRKQRTA
ncbi:helix-turn-helix domain-containing protein [Larkinella punicea]|uniref:AraC family transcriptional regulator n=1 Tax=Larkinella punicea TaxID=2315727 RepID=A0A368JMK3_9BACT|nr:AraC family transcriptional regulator [Larkinella punicea]RCR68276.1 AraC family transcriptional regulator [Larkinella punicea]